MKRIAISVLFLGYGMVFSQENQKTPRGNGLQSAAKIVYQKDSTAIVAKYPLKTKEVPQVFHDLPGNLIKDQMAYGFQTLVNNATGVTRLLQATGLPGNGGELYTMRGFAVQPRLVNGMPYLNNIGIDPATIESVEIIKGPSAVLFGNQVSAYGGLMSINGKKPKERFAGEIGGMMGSNQLNRYTLDVNTPVTNNVLARLVAVYHNENSFQDAGFNKRLIVAPSVKVTASDRLSVLVNAEIRNTTAANAPQFFLSRTAPLSFRSTELFEKNYNRSFTNNTLTMQNPSFGLQSQAVYKINSQWTSQTLLSASLVKTDGYHQYLADLADGNRFTRMISKASGNTNSFNVQQNLMGDFVFKNFRNRVVVGLDFLTSEVTQSATPWVANGTVSLRNGTDTGVLSPEDTDRLLQGLSAVRSSATATSSSFYANDLIDFLPNLSAMVGFRIDHFNGLPFNAQNKIKSQTAFSPKVGVVYTPLKDKVTVFANYMNGFNNVAPANVANANGSNPSLKAFRPERANQFEIGTRSNLYKDKVSVTASYYYMLVSNRVMVDPANPNNRIQEGRVSSKGLELSVIANPLEGLNVIAGYSHNDAEVLDDHAASGFLGRRPEEAGPQNLFNFWASYKFPSGPFNGFSAGLGGNYAGEHKVLHRRNTGTFTLPSYLVLNAVMSYAINKYAVTLRVDNFTNQKYFTGWTALSPQNTRTFAIGLELKF